MVIRASLRERADTSQRSDCRAPQEQAPATQRSSRPRPQSSDGPSPLGEHEFICPLSGEIVDDRDTDQLIDTYERLDRFNKTLYGVMLHVRQSLADKTVGTAKTRRVKGERREAEVKMPDDKWDGTSLRKIWDEFPEFRDGYLRISGIAPQAREVAKLPSTNGTERFNEFRDRILRANEGPTGTATIKIEK